MSAMDAFLQQFMSIPEDEWLNASFCVRRNGDQLLIDNLVVTRPKDALQEQAR